MKKQYLSRRNFVKVGSLGLGAVALMPAALAKGTWIESKYNSARSDQTDPNVMKQVCDYVSKTSIAELPSEVVEKAKHHILDTITASVLGATLDVGKVAIKFGESLGNAYDSQIIGSSFVTNTINAALINGTTAHADETDDSHEPSWMHPGCSVIPAALAVGEKQKSSGMEFLRGVVAGYDIGCRMNRAFGREILDDSLKNTHAIGGCFGAAMASASILKLGRDQIRYVFDYAGQQASGVNYLMRDKDHMEKAFVFGGMPARSGVTAAMMVDAGFTGIWDCFTGEANLMDAFSTKPDRGWIIKDLGKNFEIMETNIKKYSVGSPIQAPLDALIILMEKHGLTAENVKSIKVSLPDLKTVDEREMPDVNLQYIMAVTLLDGQFTFDAAHSLKRMKDPKVLAVKRKIEAIADFSLVMPETDRTALVEITTIDGSYYKEHIEYVHGTAQNPMNTADVQKKSRTLLDHIIGKKRAIDLVDIIWNLEKLDNIRKLRSLINGSVS